MCAAGIEATGLLEQEAGQHRDDQRRAQRVEGVAESTDVGLFLHDIADRDLGAVGGVNAIDGAAKLAHDVEQRGRGSGIHHFNAGSCDRLAPGIAGRKGGAC